MALEYRREQKDLTLLYKFKMSAIHINFDVTRNFNENNLKLISNHKQNYFRDSFFPRLVALWNNLKQDLKDFCYRLLSHECMYIVCMFCNVTN